MDKFHNAIEKLQEEQDFHKNSLVSLYENFNIFLENQKTKVENQDIVIQNQSRIIGNQDVIVSNQLNIIKNQKQIVENQVTLAVILKSQARLLQKIENLNGNNITEQEASDIIQGLFAEVKQQFDLGLLDMQKI